MDRISHPLAAWLGPALDDLTDDQLDQLTAESAAIDARYPDEDEAPEREAALTAAFRYLAGEVKPIDAANSLYDARMGLVRAMAASQQIAVMAVADGMSEVKAAEATGIDRMTLRKVLGKR